MKKLLLGLLITTFCMVSFISIKQFGYEQFQLFNSDEHKLVVSIDEGKRELSKKENFKLLNELAEKLRVNLERTSFELDEDGNQVIVYYSTLGNPAEYFRNIHLKRGHYLTGSSNENLYLSTKKSNHSKQIGEIALFYSADPIEIRPFIAAAHLKDVKGLYQIDDDNKVEEFEQLARENGFELTISEKNGIEGIQGYEYEDLISNVVLVLCLLILLAMLYDVSENYKTISIRRMLGESHLSIGLYLFKRYGMLLLLSLMVSFIGIIIFLFFYNSWQQLMSFLAGWIIAISPIVIFVMLFCILAWISTLTINITTMVKNQKPVKLMFGLNLIVRLVLSVFLVLGLQQGIYTLLELQSVSKQDENWSVLKEYNYLGSGPETKLFTLFNEEKRQEDFKRLFKELMDTGSFYIFPSPYYNIDDSLQDANDLVDWQEESMVIEINENYLEVNPIKDVHGKEINNLKFKDKTINIFIPEKLATTEADIVSSIKNNYQSSFNLDETEPIDIEVIYVKDNQTYFSYSPFVAQDTDYLIKDPIVIVINEAFDPLLLFSYLSMGYGGFYNKNESNIDPFKQISSIIEENNFHLELEPLAVAYGLVELEMAQGLEELRLVMIYCAIFMILTTVLIYFTTSYYIEMNKQQIGLQVVFGHTFMEKHGLALLTLLVFWYVSWMCSYIFTKDLLSLSVIVLGLTLIDVLFMSFLLIKKEAQVTKKVLIIK